MKCLKTSDRIGKCRELTIDIIEKSIYTSTVIETRNTGANRKGSLFCMRKGGSMSKRAVYEAKTEELLLPIVEEKGFEFVDVEYVKEGSNYYLRAYIDKPGGITINDLESVSRILSEKLDEVDFIPDAYILEVSSPGLGRPMKKDRDFERNLKKVVEVHLFKAIEGEKQFIGILKAYDKDTITLDDGEGNETVFERKLTALVREYIEF